MKTSHRIKLLEDKNESVSSEEVSEDQNDLNLPIKKR